MITQGYSVHQRGSGCGFIQHGNGPGNLLGHSVGHSVLITFRDLGYDDDVALVARRNSSLRGSLRLMTRDNF